LTRYRTASLFRDRTVPTELHRRVPRHWRFSRAGTSPGGLISWRRFRSAGLHQKRPLAQALTMIHPNRRWKRRRKIAQGSALGFRIPRSLCALKGRRILPPLQGGPQPLQPYPGRCPGLITSAPLARPS